VNNNGTHHIYIGARSSKPHWKLLNNVGYRKKGEAEKWSVALLTSTIFIGKIPR
jgi:hypothetical protein